MAAIFVLLLVVAVVGLIAWLIMYSMRQVERRRAVWREVAAARGGRFVMPEGFWRRKNERIELHVGDVPVVVDTYTTSNGNNSTTYTRVRATVRGIPGCRFRVYREGVFSSLGKALGTQDIVIGGHRGFDDHFMVKADQPALVRRVFEPHLMQLMFGGFPAATLRCDGRELTLVEVGIWRDAPRLHAGIDLVAGLAQRDVYNAGQLNQVAGAHFRWTEAGTPRVELDAPARVVIEPALAGDALDMVATLAEAPRTSPMTLEVTAGKPVDGELASKLPQGAHVHLSRVGSGILEVGEGGARFAWRGVDHDAATLRAGAELLGSLTGAEAAGVYR